MSTSPAQRLPIAVPGARGAYSQRASRRYFGSGTALLSCDTASDAIRAITEGRAAYAVIPVENTITGIFDGVADAFFCGDVAVVGEVQLPIRHALMAAPGVRLEDLSVVTAHVASLSQCRDWLTEWGLATRPTKDTSFAARELMESGDEGLGVLGSRDLAGTYGLEVLAEGLSDQPDNRTRFLVIGSSEECGENGFRHAIQVGPVETPRTLKTLRIQLESLGACRVRVPFLGTEDGRRYLVEFDQMQGGGSKTVERACGSMPHRFLGAWAPNASGALRAG